MTEELALRPLARVVGGRSELLDDGWGEVRATLRLAAWVPDGVLAGLEGFSHLEVVYVFDQVSEDLEPPARRHPRGRRDLPIVGALAQRNKDRFGRIGLSRCRILSVAEREIEVEGLDALDGSPVLDLKPWFSAFGPRGEQHEPEWVAEVVGQYY